MGPGIDAVGRAAQAFADPRSRARIRQWHGEGVPLIEMAERLGIGEFFDSQLRRTIAALKPEEVVVIREAMLAELDRVGDTGTPDLPIDCEITSVSGEVDVTPIRVDGRPFARVTPANT